MQQWLVSEEKREYDVDSVSISNSVWKGVSSAARGHLNRMICLLEDEDQGRARPGRRITESLVCDK